MGAACRPTETPGESEVPCADGLCVAFDNASGFCTHACEGDDNCPETYRCEASGAYGRICKKLAGCGEDRECPAGHVCNPATGNCYIRVFRTLCAPCQDPLQCPAGGTCFAAVATGERFCTTACADGGACPAGFECRPVEVAGGAEPMAQCVPVAETCNAGKPLCSFCRGDEECGGAYDLCVRNVVSQETFCGADCRPDDPGACPEGFGCADVGAEGGSAGTTRYQCVPNSNTCRDYCDAVDELGQIRQCGLGRQCDLAARRCQGASDGRECAPCSTHDDCRGGGHPENRCIVNDCANCSYRNEAFCASPCADDPACVRAFGPGFVCRGVVEADGSMRPFCIPQRGSCRAGLGKVGDDCTEAGAEACVAGICIELGSQSLCSAPCRSDLDCADARFRCCAEAPTGYDCGDEARTGSGPKQGFGLCAPIGGLFGDDCSPGRAPCQSGTCLDLGTARLCTAKCPPACPPGFGCRPAELLDGSGQTEVCFPEGGGQPGADCTFGPAACESGLCVRKASGPVCSATCVEDSDCPGGWACVGTQTVDDQSVEACLPPAVQ